MTRDDIIRMARELRLYGVPVDALERFAVLVAAAEREACAKVCEAFDKYAAAAIRARGEA